MRNLDVIHGLALQSAFTSGRINVKDRQHLSVGDVARLISQLTKGKIREDDFLPVSRSHTLCYGSTFLEGIGDDFEAITRRLNEDDYRGLFDPQSPQGAVFMEIMPVAGSFEQPVIQTNGGVANLAYGGPAAIEALYERRTDYDFWRDLGRRCGQESYWSWDTLEDSLREILAPTGVSCEDFAGQGAYAPDRTYSKYKIDGFCNTQRQSRVQFEYIERIRVRSAAGICGNGKGPGTIFFDSDDRCA